MHPFQPHLPTNRQDGEVLPPYQSIKKAVPMMYQENGIELMPRDNQFNGLQNPATNGQILPPQPGAYPYPPNQVH